MKRVILSSNIFADERLNALRKLQSMMSKDGIDCEVNKRHRCVDVFDENGLIVEQRYVKEDGKISSVRTYYQYVGPGNGDFIQLTRPTQVTKYSTEDPYIKFIRSTNDPGDPRNQSTS